MSNWLAKLLQRPRTPERYVAQAQKIISSALPADSGYATRYRQEEADYWSAIANWISTQPKRSSVIDIGCAYGTLSLYSKLVLDADVFACDAIEQEAIRRILAPHGIHYGFCNIELDALPWQRNFDLAIFTEVIEHLNFHPLPTLQKIRNSLRPGGSLMVSTPDAESDWGQKLKYYSRLNDMPQPSRDVTWVDDHIWQFSMTELLAVLEEAGFDIRQAGHSKRKGFRHLNVWAINPTN